MDVFILQIETSMKTCSVAISKNGRTIAIEETHPDDYKHSENLNLFINSLIEKCNLKISELSAIVVSSGPGSYTGLRIGTASAKGLCYALDIPLMSMDALEIMMQKFIDEDLDDSEYDFFIPMIDARRMEVYCSIYSKSSCLVPPNAKIIDETSFEELKGKILMFGEGADKFDNISFHYDITINKGFKTSAGAMSKIAYQKFLNSNFEDLAYFEPLYLKEFQSK